MPNVDLESVRDEVTTLIFCRKQMADLKKLDKLAKARVADAIGGHDVGVLDGKPVVKVTRSKKKAFDQAAFKDANPEAFESYTKITEVTTVNLISDDE